MKRKKNKRPSPLRSQRYVGTTLEEKKAYTEMVKTAPPDGLTARETKGADGAERITSVPADVISKFVPVEGERHRVSPPETREPPRWLTWGKVVSIITIVGAIGFVAVRFEQISRNSKDIEKIDTTLRQLEKNHTQISARLLLLEERLKGLFGKSEDWDTVKSQIEKLRQDLSDAMSKEAEERKMMQEAIDIRLQEIETKLENGGEGK